VNLVAIQLVSTPNVDENFAQIEAQLQRLVVLNKAVPTLVVLPESFALFGGDATLNFEHQEALNDGPIQSKLAALAVKYNIWLAGGTIPITTIPITTIPITTKAPTTPETSSPKTIETLTTSTNSRSSDKFMATTPVYNPQGVQVAHYQKIHLFDVDVCDNTASYRESDTTKAGERVVIFDIQGITVGLAVCYDVRFPGLFQQLTHAGAQIIVLPSAFTQPTGEAHWHTLLRARAIENQCYLVASSQGGVHANGRITYGHSMIVDPWGTILDEVEKGPDWVHSTFDQELLMQVRRKMPLQQHNRFKNELTN
jgi:predicted amidohydrolase